MLGLECHQLSSEVQVAALHGLRYSVGCCRGLGGLGGPGGDGGCVPLRNFPGGIGVFHSRAAQSAIAIGVLFQIVLVVFLSGNVIPERQDFGSDPAVTRSIKCLLISGLGCQCHSLLIRIMVIDGAAIIAADVVPLAVALSGIMVLP